MSVTLLAPDEVVRLDLDRLEAAWRAAGTRETEDAMCRALERTAVLLGEADLTWRQEDWGALERALVSLDAVAEPLGMSALANAGRAVRNALGSGDAVAVAATLARLLRIGERSLMAVWDRQDMPC